MSVKKVFIRAAAAYALASVLTVPIKGLPAKHEVRTLKVVVEGTLRSAAVGAINFDARDYMAVLGTGSNGGAFKKIRLTYNDKTDAINLSPAEARILAVYANGRDPFPEYFRSSPVISLNGNAGAVTAFKMAIPICFYDSNLEFPNVGCPSSMQLNRDGVELNLETDGAHAMVVGDGVLPVANGNAQLTVSGIKVYATTSKVAADFFAPTQYQRSRKLTQQPDTEKGPIWERFLAAEVDSSTYEAQVSTVTIEIDEVAAPRNVPPTELAQLFGATAQQDGILPLDITKNTLSGPFTPSSGAAGTTGLTVTPLMWQDGQGQDDEGEWNVFKQYRTLYLNPATGGDPSTTLLYWRTVPIDESRELIRSVLAERGLGNVGFEDLAVKGGPAMAMFKPRWLAKADTQDQKGDVPAQKSAAS
jgi:hypothetical protein